MGQETDDYMLVMWFLKGTLTLDIPKIKDKGF